MKVLIISTVRFRLNGITSVIMNYYRKMDKSNIQIDFVVINEISRQYKEELQTNRSEIFYLKRKSNPIKYIFQLKKILNRNKYDIVHIHGNSALMSIETVISKYANVPVRIVHSHNTTCSHKILHKFLTPILDRTANYRFACGEKAGKWLFRNKKYELIENGIDLSVFNYDEKKRTEFRRKINADNRKIIGHVGNFIYQKNHEFLIDIFNELIKIDKSYLLLLISDGLLLEQIKEKVNKLGIEKNVVFLGKTNDVASYLQCMDIFLLPSHFEGLPVVLIEAQALGLPCIVSDKVSIESKLTDLIEFLPIDDVTMWVENIINTNIDNRKDNYLNAHRLINKNDYNITNNACKMKRLYEQYLFESKKCK
ncbi:glycosyltransferase family 1 protein [Clostridium butyricum]|uniref:glycosyltransferase family 1 protein n=1 Tax=Clostridium butyricum TaxID=1492 RepID=UPI0022E0ACE7|nr:glycosyltransferase family 1 protein [Clostridium butyricum]